MIDPTRSALERGAMLVAERRHGEALEHYQRLVSEDPSAFAARQALAELLVSQGRGLEAIAQYEAACDAYAHAGRFFKAAAMCKAILRLAPEHFSARDTLTNLYGVTRGLKFRRDASTLHAPLAPASRLTPPPVSRPTPTPFDRLGALPTIPLFSELTTAEFDALLAGAVEVCTYAAGEAIVTEGEPGDAMYAICQGEVGVMRPSPTGPVEVAQLSEGDIFGEMGLVLGGRRFATVLARDEVTVLKFHRAAMEAVLAAHPGVGQALDRFYRQRLLDNFLRASPAFEPLSAGTKVELSIAFEPKTFEKGAVLMRQGQPSDGLYLILRGSCEVHDVSGARYPELHEGAHFGEISLMLGKAATATLVASSELVVLKLPAPIFQQKVLTHPKVKALLLSQARERLDRTNDLLIRNLSGRWV